MRHLPGVVGKILREIEAEGEKREVQPASSDAYGVWCIIGIYANSSGSLCAEADRKDIYGNKDDDPLKMRGESDVVAANLS